MSNFLEDFISGFCGSAGFLNAKFLFLSHSWAWLGFSNLSVNLTN